MCELCYEEAELVRTELETELRKLREENEEHKSLLTKAWADRGIAQADVILLKEKIEVLDDYAAGLAGVDGENERLREESRWIPVEERLPDHDGPVLIVLEGCVCAVESFYAADGFEGPTDFIITHWRPLPKPPEVE